MTSISEIIYEEVLMPDHHRLLTSNNLVKGIGQPGDMDIYGTSTILEILEKDDSSESKKDLDDKIKTISEELRTILFEILYQDNAISEESEEYYLSNTLFNVEQLCRFNDYIILLPPTVSRDTFNTLYYSYIGLVQLHSNYTKRYKEEIQQEEKKSQSKADIISSFLKKTSKPKKKIIYTTDCSDYIKGIKQYLEIALKDDDYIINSYKYIINLFRTDLDQVVTLNRIMENNVVEKMCRQVTLDIKEKYRAVYNFDEVIEEDGMKYKIIPEGFLVYRGYSKLASPFPKTRPYVCVGFSFLDTVNYGKPDEEEFSTNLSNDYCTLLGNVATLKTKTSLKLLDLKDLQTVELLRAKMDKKTLKSFSKGWIVKDDNVTRKSEYKDDDVVYQWLYDNNYEGYIGYGIPGLHDEACISNDKRLKDIKEYIKGNGQKFPLQLRNSFPMKQLVPICQEPFTQINYKIFSE